MPITDHADAPFFLEMPLETIPGGVIFDCDGTLADTMPLHYVAWHEILEALGCPFPEEQFYAWGGVTAVEIVERLNREHGLSMPPRETALVKEARYELLIPQVKPVTAVLDEAKRLHGLCPLAVASGGMRVVVEETLRVLGIQYLFDAVVTADDVTRGKPAPDVFLISSERLDVRPEACVVFEDAPAGFEAARAAGMRAVDVRRFTSAWKWAGG